MRHLPAGGGYTTQPEGVHEASLSQREYTKHLPARGGYMNYWYPNSHSYVFSLHRHLHAPTLVLHTTHTSNNIVQRPLLNSSHTHTHTLTRGGMSTTIK